MQYVSGQLIFQVDDVVYDLLVEVGKVGIHNGCQHDRDEEAHTHFQCGLSSPTICLNTGAVNCDVYSSSSSSISSSLIFHVLRCKRWLRGSVVLTHIETTS